MKHSRVYVIGLYGADYHLMIRWMHRGLLPHLQALAQAGNFGCLNSTIPPDTLVSWPSIYTGANPGYHGIWGSYHWNRPHQSAQIVSAEYCSMPTIWEILNEAGF
ncbi:MAG: alkaline phosphatase family protein, partial [Gemmatimonadota bacterium]